MINSLTLDYDLSAAIAYLASIDNPTEFVARALARAEAAQMGGDEVLMRVSLVMARAAYADWQVSTKGVTP